MKKTYYITTPIYYPSDNFHVGHCYTTCIADALNRRKKLEGYETYFLTGSDEHGQKIEQRAKLKNLEPKEFIDPIIENAKDLWNKLDIKYDKFIRTTDKQHIKCVQKIMDELYKKDDIYKSYYEGWYCTPCESFWTEAQLVDKKCPDCNREVTLEKEEAYFLRLSKYQDQFEKYLQNNKELMQPQSRYNEMYNNFLKPGLKDLCVSRSSVKWGIPCTFDPNQTVYVWIDALTNYISALGYKSDDETLFNKFWPCDLHLVGKEIFRFHTIIWPIILMALGLKLPKKVYGHGWLTIAGSKISKSKSNYKDPREFINDYGCDTLRYYILSEVPFGQDGNFSEELMIERRNSDLCNVYGNLVNRTIAMVNKYFDGVVSKTSNILELDKEVIELLHTMDNEVKQYVDELDIPKAIKSIFMRIERLNKYIDETCPWTLFKDENSKQRLNDVLYTILEGIRLTTIELSSFIPSTCNKVFNFLNTNLTKYNDLTFSLSDGYTVTSNPEILFERIDEKLLQEKLQNENVKTITHKPEISIDEFNKAEIVTASVVDCKKHPKADRLLISQVDVGNGEIRQIISGIAEHIEPKDFIGKKVLAVLNLKPVKLKGEMSYGMILVAKDETQYEILSTSLESGCKVS